MVARGIRKALNDDIEAQKASVEAAERQRQEELDKQRFRRAVYWYDVKSGLWCEVEAVRLRLDQKIVWTFHTEKPTRYIGGWGYTNRETGEYVRLESGFVADGLPHPVWIGGPLIKEHLRVKSQCILISNIGKLPDLFWELYKTKVSIPMIQEAFKEYHNGRAKGNRH
ncbi:hypothetical protein ACFLW8_05120 [Chloroflexota bacterium]